MSVSLVCGLTQSRKTKRTFDVLKEKLALDNTSSLVLYITQANCTVSASQVISRARDDEALCLLFGEKTNIVKSAMVDSLSGDNAFIADYWNCRNIDRIIEYVESDACDKYRKIIIVIDEADSGGQSGLLSRLSFVRDVELAVGERDCPVSLILVTATVANLSKSVAGLMAASIYKESPVLNELLYTNQVEYHFVQPAQDYIGPSWFLANAERGRLHVLKFDKRDKEQDKSDWLEKRNEIIEGAIASLDECDKRLSLIVVATKKDDHNGISMRLLEKCGYNIVVELNSECVRDYTVYYRVRAACGEDTGIIEWKIPVARIERLANKGELAIWQDPVSLEFIETGLDGFEDVSLAHILCAALLMNTKGFSKDNMASMGRDIEWARLSVLARAMKRPRDYPIETGEVKIGIVAGHIASRGNTIQNAAIGFVCTSHCFTDSIDTAQRGAINAQRFGRVCGMLLDAYRSRGREPMVIATEAILRDALGNENALVERPRDGGEKISLADFISSGEWSRCLRRSKNKVIQAGEVAKAVAVIANRVSSSGGAKIKIGLKKTDTGESSNNVPIHIRMEMRLIELMRAQKDGIMELTTAALGAVDPELNSFVRAQNRYLFTHMASKGIIKNIEPKKSIWQLIS